MSQLTPVFPRQKAPHLSVETVDGDTWTLAERSPENFTMIVVYRGLHCPICKGYLNDLKNKLSDFEELGIEVFVVSNDTEERARQARDDWDISDLTIGYGLDLDTARKWGLYISGGIGKTSAGVEEPELFVEPGLFLIRADGTIYFASVQTMPFARPQFGDVLGAAKFVLDKDYPARGEVIDHTVAQAAE